MDYGVVPYTLTAWALSQSGSYDLNVEDFPVCITTYDMTGRVDAPRSLQAPPVIPRDEAQLAVAGFRPRPMEDDPAAELGISTRLRLRVAAPEWPMAPRDGEPPADRLTT